MKLTTIILIFSVIYFMAACSGDSKNNDEEITSDLINNPATESGKSNDDKMPEISFKKTTHDFGEIAEGVNVSYAFKFTNTGNKELLITNVVPSCGCTASDFPEKPIKPGDSEYISVVFDSEGREGTFIKDIMVYANTIPNSVKLYIKGKVN